MLIDEDSFSLVDGDTFEADSVSATLELNEVLGSSANVSITLLVQTLDGEVLSNQTKPSRVVGRRSTKRIGEFYRIALRAQCSHCNPDR